MQRVETSLEVRGSVSSVYEQWKRFEHAPRFPENGGSRRPPGGNPDNDHALAAVPESNAPIVQFEPPQRIIASHSIGAFSRRIVAFHPVGHDSTRVTLSLEYETDGNVEDVSRFLEASVRGIQADLRRFRVFLGKSGQARGGAASRAKSRTARPATLH
jgi:uncharacterized membrane protein